MQRTPEGTGWIEVICGSMFSGKTEELISRLRREQIARKHVQIFKPATDDRYAVDAVVSHTEHRLPCVAVHHAHEIPSLVEPETAVVGIDEVQFFGVEVVAIADRLATLGLRVICAGLDQDYLGRPFEPMPQLLAVAEFITKKLAVCMVCGNPANRSQRLSAREGRVVLGAFESYEPRCRRCHRPAPAADQPSLPIEGAPGPAPAHEQPSLPFSMSRETS
ncbi:MAG: thymidine kinase [Myxococcales bacterium]|nr:thymidine kinase [Myxococcales bacterium]